MAARKKPKAFLAVYFDTIEGAEKKVEEFKNMGSKVQWYILQKKDGYLVASHSALVSVGLI